MNRDVSTQAEFDAALAAGETPVIRSGVIRWQTFGTDEREIIVAGGDVEIVARGSSQPRIDAWGSSQPRIVARGSSQPRIDAWGSSQPRIDAWGSSQISLKGKVVAKATEGVAVLIEGTGPQLEGGGYVRRFVNDTPEKWCAYYGLPVVEGAVVLYKAVKADGRSPKGTDYSPGLTPEAPDWDGAKRECGGGLHFSPSPGHARGFYELAMGTDEGIRYMACPALLAELVVHPDGEYPEKCKGKRICAPTWEVNEDGEPLPGAVVSWPPPTTEAAQAKSAPAKKPTRRRKAKP